MSYTPKKISFLANFRHYGYLDFVVKPQMLSNRTTFKAH